VLPSLDEFRDLLRVFTDFVVRTSDMYDRRLWAVPIAWEYPGTLAPIIIAPKFAVPQIVPPYQTDAQSFNIKLREITSLNPASNVLAGSDLLSIESVFQLARPLVSLLIAGGLPHTLSLAFVACLGAWVGLLASIVTQLSWPTLALCVINLYISFLGEYRHGGRNPPISR
jgi:hypothetical protein